MRAMATLLVLLAASAQAPAQEALDCLSLPDLVREALDHNPEIQMGARTLEAKRARVPQAAALPDAILMYGVINEGRPVPFQTLGERDFSEAYVGVSQDLPFPGKRRLRKAAAQEEVEAAQSAYEGARRRVAADVAEAYYDLYATHAGVDLVEDSARLLDQLIQLTYKPHTRRSLDPMYSFGGTLTLPNVHDRQKHAVQEAAANLGGARSAADMSRAEVRYAVT